VIPSIGRIVLYKLNSDDVSVIRTFRSDISGKVGNSVSAGDIFPMIITKVFDNKPTTKSSVNGQVFLDGNDNLWVVSVLQGHKEREWHDPRDKDLTKRVNNE
jgi:hypothetical protein